MSQQLVKKGANGKYSNVNPKSWTEAIKDKNTGQNLVEILQGFNMYFLSYTGDKESTRCLVPNLLRKKGLWITYVDYDNIVHTEWYAANSIEDISWRDSSNWRIGNNMLVGDISISSNGNWVINGKETSYKAIGERGYTPILRVGSNNKLQVSYNEGYTYSNVSEDNVFTQFKIIDNKLNSSTDLGKTWNPVSDYIASWIRWQATTGDTQANNVGRIQISKDNKTWTNLSNDIINNLHISKYIGADEPLPTSGIAEGTIYAKGPTYAEDDSLNENPIYRLWVYAWKDNALAWVDNGEFTSIAAGVVQETGDSETEVMSQKAISDELRRIEYKDTFFENTEGEFAEHAKTYEAGILGMFIDKALLDVTYVSLWYYDTDLGNKTLNSMCKVKGSDEKEWLMLNYPWDDVIENVPIPITHNDVVVGYVAIKDKTVFSTYPKGYGISMNIETITKDIQYHVLKEMIDNTNKDVESLKSSLIGGTKTVYINEGEIEYYQQFNSGYTAYMMGQISGNMEAGTSINKIVAGPIRIKGKVDKVNYGVYIATTSMARPAGRTLVQKGEIPITTEFKECTIFLDEVLTLEEDMHLAIVFYSYGENKVQILGTANEADITVYPNSRVGIILIDQIPEEGIDNIEWHYSYINSEGTRGFAIVSPRLYLQTGGVTVAEFEKNKEEVNERLDALEENGGNGSNEVVEVQLPDKIYAVVGDTLQVFYRSIIKAVNPYNYDIVVSSSKGATYPRYWKYTPTPSDVGSASLSVTLKNEKGKIVGSASTTIVTSAAPQSPSNNINIFTFGDSLTTFGYWVGEANRRLTNTNSFDGIVGNGLTNLTFCGKKNAVINDTPTNYFGVGGWTWYSYISAGETQYRVYVSNVNTVSLNSQYINNDNTYEVIEVNVTDGTGNLLLSGTDGEPTDGGTLFKSSGDGDSSIVFSSYEKETNNPLWDVENDKMSFVPYVNEYGNGQIDVAYVLLTWNGLKAWNEYKVTDVSGHIANAKTFADTLHKEYPNAKLKIMGIQLPSLNGGLGANYGSSGDYSELYGLCYCAFSYNKALQDLCNLDEYNSFCEFVDVASQFDSENNMPESLMPVNTRSTKKEYIGTNGVHPTKQGYFQIGDVVYRNIVANYCK